MDYLSALVKAWEPDHLAVVTQKTMVDQGQKRPEATVGRLTYLREGIPLQLGLLGDVDVTEADGGRYVKVPGDIENPSLDYPRQVRQALGYENP